MWFETLTGFGEDEVDSVAQQFAVRDETMTSLANGRILRQGRFETPTLRELRSHAQTTSGRKGRTRLREVVADVQGLHLDPENSGAFFQVASQLNALEMSSPELTPEAGIDRYEHDRTQGPACAIACGAGTIFRNYLISIDGFVGQREQRQINLLQDLSAAIDVDIPVRNGYALPSREQLVLASDAVRQVSDRDRSDLMGYLRIGIQWDTEVTLGHTSPTDASGPGHTVTQAYCSAMPVAYSLHDSDLWEPLAQLVLDAAYEASLATALMNCSRTENSTAYLTLLGGGAFGNRPRWILNALDRAVRIFEDTGLDIAVVSHRNSNPNLRDLLRRSLKQTD